MSIANLFKIALRAIAANKLRSFLTMLGIIIGVASVITMLAIGQGSKKSIQKQISEMGSNMIMIMPGQDMRGGVRRDASEMETLKLTDYDALKDQCQYISAISPVVNSSGQFIYGNKTLRQPFTVLTAIISQSVNCRLRMGRCLPTKTSRPARKCVLSERPLLTIFSLTALTPLAR